MIDIKLIDPHDIDFHKKIEYRRAEKRVVEEIMRMKQFDVKSVQTPEDYKEHVSRTYSFEGGDFQRIFEIEQESTPMLTVSFRGKPYIIRLKEDDKMKRISFTVDDDLYRKLLAQSIENERSLSRELRGIIRMHFKKQVEEK